MNAIKKAIKPERERTGTSPTAAVHTDNAHEDTLSDGDAERESEWPAVVEGQPLHAIAIPLLAIPLDSVHVDKKKDMHVSVAVSSAIAGKAGHIRFEFNKGWIGSSK
jgi:hypothetical protein